MLAPVLYGIGIARFSGTAIFAPVGSSLAQREAAGSLCVDIAPQGMH